MFPDRCSLFWIPAARLANKPAYFLADVDRYPSLEDISEPVNSERADCAAADAFTVLRQGKTR